MALWLILLVCECFVGVGGGNTLVLLIGKRAPLKKPASETTYFELLVLAFRVFEFQRSKVENSEEVLS